MTREHYSVNRRIQQAGAGILLGATGLLGVLIGSGAVAEGQFINPVEYMQSVNHGHAMTGCTSQKKASGSDGTVYSCTDMVTGARVDAWIAASIDENTHTQTERFVNRHGLAIELSSIAATAAGLSLTLGAFKASERTDALPETDY